MNEMMMGQWVSERGVRVRRTSMEGNSTWKSHSHRLGIEDTVVQK
jgi:hypothetical protein